MNQINVALGNISLNEFMCFEDKIRPLYPLNSNLIKKKIPLITTTHSDSVPSHYSSRLLRSSGAESNLFTAIHSVRLTDTREMQILLCPWIHQSDSGPARTVSRRKYIKKKRNTNASLRGCRTSRKQGEGGGSVKHIFLKLLLWGEGGLRNAMACRFPCKSRNLWFKTFSLRVPLGFISSRVD